MNTIRRNPRYRGITLIELLLALAGTGLVAAAMATMLVAVAYGTQSDKDLRTLVVKHKTLDGRLGAAIRGSSMVLDQGDDFIVLWTYDTDESGTPNLAELRRIELVNGVVNAYRAPDTLDPALNTEYTLADDFDAITVAIKGGATFPGESWGTNVTEWSLTLDEADPQLARLVSYRFTFAAGDLSDTAINAAALRN